MDMAAWAGGVRRRLGGADRRPGQSCSCARTASTQNGIVEQPRRACQGKGAAGWFGVREWQLLYTS
ncbi:unnamed protein product [Spirodela intermedia]|uniref:Uncharacterized protein n=1 Tax=Spirodela intermedia TaxID=51605 RepID=A0ABN7E9P5_SPIIN|nr:unnamed protein product [Spirodela intermedia]